MRLLLAVLLATGAVRAQAPSSGTLRVEGFGDAIGRALARVVQTSQAAVAAARASALVAADLEAKRKAKMTLMPDLSYLQTALKLRMRVSNGELTVSTGTYRRYPEQKDFERQAKKAQKKIRRYVRRAPAGEPLDKDPHAQAISDILQKQVVELAHAMPVDPESTAQPPPPDAEEARLLREAGVFK